MTREQQDIIAKINKMNHEEMCNLWRSAPFGHPYFNGDLPYYKVFAKRLFDHFGGFSPTISKKNRGELNGLRNKSYDK